MIFIYFQMLNIDSWILKISNPFFPPSRLLNSFKLTAMSQIAPAFLYGDGYKDYLTNKLTNLDVEEYFLNNLNRGCQKSLNNRCIQV